MKRALFLKGMSAIFTVFLLTTFSASISWAMYPEKPITLIQSWPAGGGLDVSVRPMMNAASRILGQPISFEYHTGGSGAVGMSLLNTKKPDGYTIGVTSVSTLVQQNLQKVPFDLTKGFTPIMKYLEVSYGLAVKASSPWKTFQELLDYAKANPGKVRYASAGPAGPQNMTMAALAKKHQINWTLIPFEGGSVALTAILGGHVEAYSTTVPVSKAQAQAGNLRFLVVFSEKRAASFPDVPCSKELGYPVMFPIFYALFAPRGLSSEILETLHKALRKGMDDSEFLKTVDMMDQVVSYQGPQDFANYLVKHNEEIKEMLIELKMTKK